MPRWYDVVWFLPLFVGFQHVMRGDWPTKPELIGISIAAMIAMAVIYAGKRLCERMEQ